MKKYNKPLPQIKPWSAPFWEGCKRRELLIQKCQKCDKYVFYPKLFCPYCLSAELIWVTSSGKGNIYSYSVVHSYAPTEFNADTPYAVAVIQLDEGVRMMSNVIDCELETIRCEMRVEVVFEDVTEEITLPKFRPTKK